jgi:3-hydroxyacyl-CoA dehydrogenase
MASLTAEQFAQDSPMHHAVEQGRSPYQIRKVAVLGAGTMGARIAAHMANSGLPVLLLDLPSSEGIRNGIAARALEGLKTSKPAALADPSFASRISIGNFEDDLPSLKGYDWIIEAVAENLEIKRGLLGKVIPHLHPAALLTTNTSGLPVAQIAEAFSPEIRRRWFGTHFFNPPRYMRLIEIIATPETDRQAVAAVEEFADLKLGKTVVAAKDVPNFIANRIGTFSLLNTLRIMQEQGLTIEEIDALTGSIIGWPKTGTFRLSDMVGIDVLASVAGNFARLEADERADLKVPAAIHGLIERKWLGDKTRQGFYKKERSSDGKETRLVLDMESFEYRPAARPALPELEMAKTNDSIAARIRSLLNGNPEKDKAARFYWRMLPELWSYAANRIGEVADSIVEIDLAMKAGFNWTLGPFEMWDAAGFQNVVDRMRAMGTAIPPAAQALLESGGTSWYRTDEAEYFDLPARRYAATPRKIEEQPVSSFKTSHAAFAENVSVSLVDIGDGIGCFEFHSKMNSIGQDIVDFVRRQLRPDSEAVKNFDGFIFANDADNFSAGANLMQMLLAIQDEEWDELDASIRAFQGMTQAIKFCPRPVVAAPFGLCLGGGTEIAMHSALRQAHLELYTGLVETGVGLLPAGGGCKEMLLLALDAAGAVRTDPRGESVEVYDALRQVFETIAMAKVSTSAYEARNLRILQQGDGITMNRARLVADAKAQAVGLARSGYAPPIPRNDIPAPGQEVLATLKAGVYMMRQGEYISDHDAKIATHVAHVLTGGAVPAGTRVSEQYLLDLEREGFLSLCGEKKTAERIGFTLKTGKPLRN